MAPFQQSFRRGSDAALSAYAATLALAVASLVAILIASGQGLGPPAPVLALAALAYAAERQSVRLSATAQVSVGFLPFVFAAVAFGPLAAMFVAAFGLLSELRAPYVRWLVWTASRSIVAGAAGLAALAVGGPSGKSFAVLTVASVAAAVTEVVVDALLGAATVSVRGSGSLRAVLKTQGPIFVASIPLYIPVIAVLAYAYKELSPWSVALFLIPGIAAQRLFMLYREQRQTAEELARAIKTLERANLSFASALVATLDARDHYTAGHSTAVASYARDIAARLGLSPEAQQLVHLAGLVHDIGKIGLPPGLLEKTGPLTLDERRQMEQHSVIGERILANVDDYAEIATIVRHHHEWVNGNGYPDGLVGSDIPLLARIIAVADAYDAMTSDRPYRDAMPSRVARLRLAQAVETQFDTAVVAAFEAILAGSNREYLSGQDSNRGREVTQLWPVARAVN